MKSGDAAGVPSVNKDQNKAINIDFGLGGKNRSLRTMSPEEIGKFSVGDNGTSLDEVIHHGTSSHKEYGLIDESFLEALHAEPAKIKDLMERLGETRDEVSIVASAAGGGYTRMFLKRNSEGNYEETKKEEDSGSTDRTKTHYQDKDLIVFEKGVKPASA